MLHGHDRLVDVLHGEDGEISFGISIFIDEHLSKQRQMKLSRHVCDCFSRRNHLKALLRRVHVVKDVFLHQGATIPQVTAVPEHSSGGLRVDRDCVVQVGGPH